MTQATVSRDIKEMMLIKVPDEDGRYKYSFPSENSKILTTERLEDTLRSYTLTISSAENLIVLHTLPVRPRRWPMPWTISAGRNCWGP